MEKKFKTDRVVLNLDLEQAKKLSAALWTFTSASPEFKIVLQIRERIDKTIKKRTEVK